MEQPGETLDRRISRRTTVKASLAAGAALISTGSANAWAVPPTQARTKCARLKRSCRCSSTTRPPRAGLAVSSNSSTARAQRTSRSCTAACGTSRVCPAQPSSPTRIAAPAATCSRAGPRRREHRRLPARQSPVSPLTRPDTRDLALVGAPINPIWLAAPSTGASPIGDLMSRLRDIVGATLMTTGDAHDAPGRSALTAVDWIWS